MDHVGVAAAWPDCTLITFFGGREMRYSRTFGWLALASMMTAPLSLARAANDPDDSEASDETTRLNQKKELLTLQAAVAVAEKSKLAAEQAVAQQKLAGLNLPQFDNKTTVTGEGGKLEAAMLGGYALRKAADKIKEDICKDNGCPSSTSFVVLSDDEKLDFGVAESLAAELKYVGYQLKDLRCEPEKKDLRCEPEKTGTAGAMVVNPGTVIAVATAVGKLFNFEVEISAVDLKDALPGRLLAARLTPMLDGYRPDAIIAMPSGANSLVETLDKMRELATCLAEKRASLTASDATEKAAIDKVMTRYEDLYVRVTTADKNGSVPIIAAQRLAWLAERPNLKVVRVRVERAAGSFVTTKNLWTTLGVDPLKVSGGVIVSYQVTDPRTGQQDKDDVLVCRTNLASLRKVQEATWRQPANGSSCAELD